LTISGEAGLPPFRGRTRPLALQHGKAILPAKADSKRLTRLGADMKVNIEIDCTPVEARQFMGLPDVVPMQTAVMDKMQQQMMSNIEKVSPESLMQTWFSFDPKIVERFQDMFVAMAGLGAPKKDKK
jgi:hypothetical protein